MTGPTRKVVMRCLALADGTTDPARCPTNQFLKDYDPETGESEWTFAMSEALTLPAADAMTLWRSVHPTQPVRPWDGQPNRPLTAFTVEFIPVEGT